MFHSKVFVVRDYAEKLTATKGRKKKKKKKAHNTRKSYNKVKKRKLKN